MERQIVSEEVIRSRVPRPLKNKIREDMARTRKTESQVLREIVSAHYGVSTPQPWKG